MRTKCAASAIMGGMDPQQAYIKYGNLMETQVSRCALSRARVPEIGAACAIQLAAKGCGVVVQAIKLQPQREGQTRDTVKACEAAGSEAILGRGDVAKRSMPMSRARAGVRGKVGRIDSSSTTMESQSTISYDLDGLTPPDSADLRVNLIGHTRCCACARQ